MPARLTYGEYRRHFGADKEYREAGDYVLYRGTLGQYFAEQEARRLPPDPVRDAAIAEKKRLKEERKAARQLRREAEAARGVERFKRRQYEHAKLMFKIHSARAKSRHEAGEPYENSDLVIAQRNKLEMEEYERAHRT